MSNLQNITVRLKKHFIILHQEFDEISAFKNQITFAQLKKKFIHKTQNDIFKLSK